MLPDLQIPIWFQQLGVMGWPLATASVIAFAVCLERLAFLLKFRLTLSTRLLDVKQLLKQHTDLSKSLRDDLMGNVLQEWRRRALSGLGLLRLIGAIAPLLGLLGTILGIIAAFREIASHTGPVSPGLIADGLWEAMLTTAAGLFIALPALVMAHVYRQWADGLIDECCRDANAKSTLIEVEKERTQVKGKAVLSGEQAA